MPLRLPPPKSHPPPDSLRARGDFIWCDQEAQTPLTEPEWVQAALALVQMQSGKPMNTWIEGRRFWWNVPDIERSYFLDRLASLADSRGRSAARIARDLEGSLLRGLACEPYLLVQGEHIPRRREFDIIVTEDISRLWRNRAEFGPRSAELEDLRVH